jgi:hypothetical protein
MSISSNHYFDTDIEGELDSNGLIKQYYDEDAVKNSIIVWLTSFRSDILRNPGKGGYVTQYLYKGMSDDVQSKITMAITDGFKQDYTPNAVLNSISVTPDYVNKTWTIDLNIYINIIKSNVDVQTTLNSIS